MEEEEEKEARRRQCCVLQSACSRHSSPHSPALCRLARSHQLQLTAVALESHSSVSASDGSSCSSFYLHLCAQSSRAESELHFLIAPRAHSARPSSSSAAPLRRSSATERLRCLRCTEPLVRGPLLLLCSPCSSSPSSSFSLRCCHRWLRWMVCCQLRVRWVARAVGRSWLGW